MLTTSFRFACKDCLGPICLALSFACLHIAILSLSFSRRVTVCSHLYFTLRNVNISLGMDAWSRCCYVPLKTISRQVSNDRRRRRRHHQVFNGVCLNIYEISLLMGDDKEADICMPVRCLWPAMGSEDRRTENSKILKTINSDWLYVWRKNCCRMKGHLLV